MAMPSKKYYYKGHEYSPLELTEFAKKDFDVSITEKQLKCRLAKVEWNVYKAISTPIKSKRKRFLYLDGKKITLRELTLIAKEKYNNDISIQLLYNRIFKQKYDVLDAIKRDTFDDNYKKDLENETIHQRMMRKNKENKKDYSVI